MIRETRVEGRRRSYLITQSGEQALKKNTAACWLWQRTMSVVRSKEGISHEEYQTGTAPVFHV